MGKYEGSNLTEHLSHTRATSIRNIRSECGMKEGWYKKELLKKEEALEMYRELLKEKRMEYGQKLNNRKAKHSKELKILEMLIEK